MISVIRAVHRHLQTLSGKKQTVILTVLVMLLLAVVYTINLEVNEIAVQNKAAVSKQDMVNLEEFIPGIEIDLLYATENNVYGQKIYSISKAYLRRGTALKLRAAQQKLQSRGYSLKIWDAYRPPEAQFKLWEVMPDARFVVNPYKGYSYHSRGVAVDLTIVDQKGNELPMPSGFDDFTARADRDYSDVSSLQAQNACLLQEVMEETGLKSIYYEWWHFVDVDRDQYPVLLSSQLPDQ